MISAWHLLWIVPVSSAMGIFLEALMIAASDRDHTDNGGK